MKLSFSLPNMDKHFKNESRKIAHAMKRVHRKPSRLQMSYPQAVRIHRLKPWGDVDGDGVPNFFDCHPYNKRRQDVSYPVFTKHAKWGNRKLRKNILIYNLGSAEKCPSRKLGLCQLDNPRDCYAWNAEKQYPAPGPYRERQLHIWKTSSKEKLAEQFGQKIEGHKRYWKFHPNEPRLVRFDESGDFYDQEDVDKMEYIATKLKKEHNADTYVYTARRDLDYSNVKNLQINFSGSRPPPERDAPNSNIYKVVDKVPEDAENVCPCAEGYTTDICGDCVQCSLEKGKTIYEKLS